MRIFVRRPHPKLRGILWLTQEIALKLVVTLTRLPFRFAFRHLSSIQTSSPLNSELLLHSPHDAEIEGRARLVRSPSGLGSGFWNSRNRQNGSLLTGLQLSWTGYRTIFRSGTP